MNVVMHTCNPCAHKAEAEALRVRGQLVSINNDKKFKRIQRTCSEGFCLILSPDLGPHQYLCNQNPVAHHTHACAHTNTHSVYIEMIDTAEYMHIIHRAVCMCTAVPCCAEYSVL